MNRVRRKEPDAEILLTDRTSPPSARKSVKEKMPGTMGGKEDRVGRRGVE